MKWRDPKIWIGAFSAVGVLFLGLSSIERTTPGDLTAVHQAVPELELGLNCSLCHGSWRVNMTEACLDCHEPITAQLEAGEGLHGLLEEDAVMVCARCHSEHHGAGFEMVNVQSFTLAGAPDIEPFDHEILGFTLEGEHLMLDCSECHPHSADAILPQGERRYLGLEWSCAECHEDKHEGKMVRDCSECHGQQDFETSHSLGHEEFLPLVGGHELSDCRECHALETPHSLELLVSGRSTKDARQCEDCHSSPHQGDFTTQVAVLASTSEAMSCVVCHEAEHTDFREEGLEVTAELHAASGFFLDPPHDQQACEDCHAPEPEDFAMRYPGRGPNECRLCHEDPHGGQFDTGVHAAEGCVSCHHHQRFEPHHYSLEDHAATALPLVDTHSETDCNECHVLPADGAPRIFDGTAATCEGCHGDAHRGYFEGFEGLSSVEAGVCARCHVPTEFAEIPPGRFDHEYWTQFAVLGAHAQSACEICHERSEVADANGRTFGWVDEHFGLVEGCATCHTDPHQGEFNTFALPQQVQGNTGCARCHSEATFRSLPNGFDHLLWTEFPVEGAHLEIGCSPCHTPLRRADEFGRTWDRANGPLCSDCHSNPHAEQFEEDGKTDCSTCHLSASSFSDLAFDHETDSRFPLGDAHQPLACAACHKPFVVKDSIEAVRYKPLGTECTDCHVVRGEKRLKDRDQ